MLLTQARCYAQLVLENIISIKKCATAYVTTTICHHICMIHVHSFTRRNGDRWWL